MWLQSNAKFAVHADPDNELLRKRKAEIDDMRSKVGAWVRLPLDTWA